MNKLAAVVILLVVKADVLHAVPPPAPAAGVVCSGDPHCMVIKQWCDYPVCFDVRVPDGRFTFIHDFHHDIEVTAGLTARDGKPTKTFITELDVRVGTESVEIRLGDLSCSGFVINWLPSEQLPCGNFFLTVDEHGTGLTLLRNSIPFMALEKKRDHHFDIMVLATLENIVGIVGEAMHAQITQLVTWENGGKNYASLHVVGNSGESTIQARLVHRQGRDCWEIRNDDTWPFLPSINYAVPDED